MIIISGMSFKERIEKLNKKSAAKLASVFLSLNARALKA
jgi:hypothetical protein